MGWYNGWSPGRANRHAAGSARRHSYRGNPKTRYLLDLPLHAGTGSENPVWLHDEDYSQPLLAYHVCRSCHRLLHERFERPEPWRALVHAHGTGDLWFKYLTMDPAAQWRPLA